MRKLPFLPRQVIDKGAPDWPTHVFEIFFKRENIAHVKSARDVTTEQEGEDGSTVLVGTQLFLNQRGRQRTPASPSPVPPYRTDTAPRHVSYVIALISIMHLLQRIPHAYPQPPAMPPKRTQKALESL